MNGHLAATVALYGLALAVWALLAAARGRGGGRHLGMSIAALELACVVQAALDVAGLAGGHRPASLATHLGYMAASVLVIPLILSARGPEPAGDGWGAAIAGVACIAASIVALRLKVTWSHA